MDRNKIKEQIRKIKVRSGDGIYQQIKNTSEFNQFSKRIDPDEERDKKSENKWQTLTEESLSLYQLSNYRPKIHDKEILKRGSHNYEAFIKSEYRHTHTYLQYLNLLDEQEKIEKKKEKQVKKVEIKEKKSYFEVDAINFSALAAIDVGPQYYKARQEDKEEKEHFLIGNCVDCLLTEPELFDSKFIVDEEEEFTNFPTPQMKKYIEIFVQTGDSGKAYDAVGFKKANILNVIERYNTEGKDYADYLINRTKKLEDNKDKKFLSKEQYNKCKNIADSLLNNRFTKKYLELETPAHVEVFNQLEIYWKMLGNNFKCKLDRVIVDNEKRTIQPIDIKTTGKHTTKFIDSLISFRYDIQGSLYYQGVCDYFWNQNSKYNGYTILPFKFIVESTKYPGSPLVYCFPHQLVDLSFDGFNYEGKYLMGWRRLYEDLQWHKENNIWDYSRRDFENEGVVDIVV